MALPGTVRLRGADKLGAPLSSHFELGRPTVSSALNIPTAGLQAGDYTA